VTPQNLPFASENLTIINMSFLDVLDSIGTGQRPAGPQAKQHSTLTSKASLPSDKQIATQPWVKSSDSKRTENYTLQNGVKRKAEDAFRAAPDKTLQRPEKKTSDPALPNGTAATKILSQSILKGVPLRTNSPAAAAEPANSPKPGTFAALMAEAKAAQEKRAKSEVGIIKHQAAPKERLSKSARRKRFEVEKAMNSKLSKQPQHNSKVEKRTISSPKKREESTYKGTAKPSAPASSYKGTAGLPSIHRPSSTNNKHAPVKKPPRYDEYLGTDEEDEGDESMEEDVDNGYGSDASSDMEAGAFDVEEEESKALRQARADDARELELESKLKREKEERRRKLEALAKKRR
jgi:SPT2 chromatin protein